MSSINRLFVCSLRCIPNRLSFPDVVLKNTKCSFWKSLLVDCGAKRTAHWPLLTRAFSSGSSIVQPVVRCYRTAPSGTTGFAQNVYDENEVCIEVSYFSSSD